MIEIKTKAAKAKESKKKGEMEEEDADQEKWKAENDARILMQAEEIKADKSRYSAAQAVAKSQADALMKVIK